jgi:hypothetical protein
VEDNSRETETSMSRCQHDRSILNISFVKMLRLHPTTLTITSAELRDLDRRYPQRNRLRNSPKQDAHPRCTGASPPTADDDESTDVNDIPTPASSAPSQVADEDAALFVAPVQSDSTPPHTPPGTTTGINRSGIPNPHSMV